MARPLRIEFAGALYHVTARGDRQEPIYEDDEDRRSFLEILGTVTEDANWVWLCHAFTPEKADTLVTLKRNSSADRLSLPVRVRPAFCFFILRIGF